jgi:transposase-like protein
MNSYETRLNDLKQLAIQLDNAEVNADIESFLIKWSETYTKISKLIRNMLFFFTVVSFFSKKKMHVFFS